MKEETPAAVKPILLQRRFVGKISAWGACFSGVYLDLEQDLEWTVRILETEDIELFTRALDDLIASCKRFSEYLGQAKQEQP